MKNKFIIDTPKLQSLRQKYTSTFLTLCFWVLWFYLWIPLVTLFGWWFQIDTIQFEMVTKEGYQAFLNALPTLLLITAILSSTLAVWALYNFLRFKGVERRLPTSTVNRQALQKAFNISEHDLNSAQSEKIITIIFDSEDRMSLTFKQKD